jgi:hypothetical protein
LSVLTTIYFSCSSAAFNKEEFKQCRESVKADFPNNFCGAVPGLWKCFDDLGDDHPNRSQFMDNLNAKIDAEGCNADLKRPY